LRLSFCLLENNWDGIPRIFENELPSTDPPYAGLLERQLEACGEARWANSDEQSRETVLCCAEGGRNAGRRVRMEANRQQQGIKRLAFAL
jgi:hypothetical protein